MKPRALLFAVLGCVLLWTTSAAAAPGQKDKTLKIGKKGEITLTQPTKVGDTTLQPGTYVVQHRVSGNDHFVRFIELKKLTDLNLSPETMGWYTYTVENNAGEIKCRVEPTGTMIEATTVTVAEDGGPKVTKVAIKGENVVHVL
jgi:VCBS repeat-containing protein